MMAALCLLCGVASAMTQKEFIDLCRTGTAEEVALALTDTKLSAVKPVTNGVTPLMNAAAARGDAASAEKIAALLAAGAKVNDADSSGMTALMYAAQFSDRPETVIQLLAAGAQRDAKDRRGWSALSYAAAKNFDARMTEILIDAGSIVDLPDSAGVTPLMLALRGGVGKGIVLALLDAGADPAMKDKSRKSVADYLAKSPLKDEDEIVSELAAPAAVRLATPSRFVQVCRLDSVDRLNALLDAGNVPNLAVDGLTPLMWAARSGAKGALAVLIERGANLNAQDPEGRTALMYAADGASLQILLAGGARVGLADKNGRTALEYAQENPRLKPADYATLKASVEDYRELEAEFDGKITALEKKLAAETALRQEKEKLLASAEAEILYLQKQVLAERGNRSGSSKKP